MLCFRNFMNQFLQNWTSNPNSDTEWMVTKNVLSTKLSAEKRDLLDVYFQNVFKISIFCTKMVSFHFISSICIFAFKKAFLLKCLLLRYTNRIDAPLVFEFVEYFYSFPKQIQINTTVPLTRLWRVHFTIKVPRNWPGEAQF